MKPGFFASWSMFIQVQVYLYLSLWFYCINWANFWHEPAYSTASSESVASSAVVALEVASAWDKKWTFWEASYVFECNSTSDSPNVSVSSIELNFSLSWAKILYFETPLPVQRWWGWKWHQNGGKEGFLRGKRSLGSLCAPETLTLFLLAQPSYFFAGSRLRHYILRFHCELSASGARISIRMG